MNDDSTEEDARFFPDFSADSFFNGFGWLAEPS
jgi:hypothetical protein